MENFDEFVESNLGLVHSLANRFRGRGIEYEELYSAGCIGLIKAARNFDKSRGFQFSTYAVPVIMGEMRRLFRDGGTVKVSRTLKELSLKVGKIRDEMMKQNGEEPHISQIADELGISAAEVSEALGVSLPPLSLTVDDESGSEYDLPVDAPEAKITDLLSLKQSLERLEPHDRQLIILRYWGEKTQSEIAQMLGMTQVQVSRREKKILSELKKELI